MQNIIYMLGVMFGAMAYMYATWLVSQLCLFVGLSIVYVSYIVTYQIRLYFHR